MLLLQAGDREGSWPGSAVPPGGQKQGHHGLQGGLARAQAGQQLCVKETQACSMQTEEQGDQNSEGGAWREAMTSPAFIYSGFS